MIDNREFGGGGVASLFALGGLEGLKEGVSKLDHPIHEPRARLDRPSSQGRLAIPPSGTIEGEEGREELLREGVAKKVERSGKEG